MSEATGELGPTLKTTLPSKEIQVYRPYQELKERLGPQQYDAVIVFGEGPVKRIFFSDEKERIDKLYKPEQIDRFKKAYNSTPLPDLKGEELRIWLEANGPRTQPDPDYVVKDIEKYGPFVDAKQREKVRGELESIARHSYKRYGELNALAAGLVLYTGKTDRLILSGGRTIPEDKIKQGLGFPSEAELIRDLIVRNFGQKMYERDKPNLPKDMTYKQYLTDKENGILKYFVIEDSATNTIDNIVRSINHDPTTFFNPKKTYEIGLLGNDHQVQRTTTLLNLFTGNEKGAYPISAQNDVLKPFAEIRNRAGKKGFFPELLRYMTDEPTNIDLQEKTKGEAIGREKLENPEDIFWWLGYIGHSDVPEVFQAVMKKLKDPKWQPYAKKGFELLGLDFDNFSRVDFAKKPRAMSQLKGGFEKILADGGSLRQQKLVI